MVTYILFSSLILAAQSAYLHLKVPSSCLSGRKHLSDEFSEIKSLNITQILDHQITFDRVSMRHFLCYSAEILILFPNITSGLVSYTSLAGKKPHVTLKL